MKKKILLVAVLQLFLVLNSCSSDSGDNSTPTPEPPVVVIKTAKITSYSKNSGETGETVTMYGENFSEKVSEIKITFDGVVATIVSATATEIVFKLPATDKLLPKLELTIENRTIVNEVKNIYNGDIGILPTHSLTNWITQENSLQEDGEIPYIQMISDKILYLNSKRTGAGIYRTLDGGITWNQWAVNGFNAGFYATANDEGWSHTGFGVSKITKGGYLGIDTFANFGSEKDIQTPYCLYVDDDMRNGTWVSQNGKVFVTSNGVDFTKVYEIVDNVVNLFQATQIDNNHIWAIGYKAIKNKEGITGNRAFILFKNNTTDGWKEYPFVNEEAGYYAREVSFADNENGFLLINNYSTLDVKLFKTTNGGDTWVQVYNGEKFTKFTFKDTNTGWAVLDNKIYKTINGGSVWTLDYTNNQPIKNISYKNNVVWAISTDKIIKRYL